MNPILVKAACTSALLTLLCCTWSKAQNAFTNDGAVVYLDNAASLYIQGSLENKSSGAFTNNGTVFISGNFTQNGTGNLNTAASGLFSFNGTGNQTISGTRQPDFYNLGINKASGECQLQTGFTLSNQLTLSSGNIFLNNQQIDLLNSGELVGENAAARIYDLAGNTGTIRVVTTLNAPSAVNPGNLGAIISSAQNLGATTVIRGHQQQFIVSANSITRYYDISPANNISLNATLRFHYLEEELNSQPESELAQWHSPNNIIWTKNGGTLNTSLNYVELTNIDTFHRVSLISNKIIPLPLHLLAFTAVKTTTGKTALTWKTEQEINCSHFVIERSANGQQWQPIGTVAAIGQQGTIQTYHYTDESPLSASNYYRLKQVDLDGRFDYSPVRMIMFGNTTAIRVYPTLARSNTLLYVGGISPERAWVQVFDNKGRLVQTTKLYSTSFHLPGLSGGIYHVKITDISSRQIIATQQILVY